MARNVTEIVKCETSSVSSVEEWEEMEEEGLDGEGGRCRSREFLTRRKTRRVSVHPSGTNRQGCKQDEGLTKYFWCRRDLF